MYTLIDQRSLSSPRQRIKGPVLGYSLLNELDRSIPFGGFAIKYVVQGVERYTVNGQFFPVHQGQYLLANARCTGSVLIDSAVTVPGLCADLTSEVMNGMVAACLHPEAMDEPAFASFFTSDEFLENTYSAATSRVGALMQRLAAGIGEDPYARHRIDRGVYLALAEAVVADHLAIVPRLRKIRAVRSGTRKDIFRRVERARSFVHDHFQSAIDVADMAHAAAMSEYHFFRAFRSVHGTSPNQYLIGLRLQHACAVLTRMDSSISDVAAACGFNDLYGFSKAFKQRYGVPPSAWAGRSRRI